ncbi:MAG: Gfo/Idh/MocA family protein, partial [Anaerovoracaceae bacterium]
MQVVLIGYGYWGPNIAKNLSSSNKTELYGICDNDRTKLEKAKAIFGDSVKYFDDYRKVLLDENVQVCAVALRDDIGQTVAKEVLKSKKHLFMEKPMAIDMKDALLLKKLAEENAVKIHVDHVLIYNPVVKIIKSIIDSGELGEVIHFESNRANLGPHIKQDMNAMWDLAVHDLAIIDFLFDGKKPTKIDCAGIKKHSDQEVLTYLTITFDNCIAMVKSSWV